MEPDKPRRRPRMRKTTKRKVLGRDQLIASIRTATYQLNKSKEAVTIEEKAAFIRSAMETLKRAAEALEIYGVDRKRLTDAIDVLVTDMNTRLESIMGKAKDIAITQDEKAIKKHRTETPLYTDKAPYSGIRIADDPRIPKRNKFP